MQKTRKAVVFVFSIGALAISGAYADNFGGKHVLLISIDGMHALDYTNCVNNGTCPNLKTLGMHGTTYPNTSTSKPSDSFPGLMAIVTGGSPVSVGAWYDVAYDRILAPPTIETGNGNPPGLCIAGHNNGATTEYEEGNEIDQTKLNGGSAEYTLLDGGIKSIDPNKLNRDPFNGCSPVYSWNFIRTNSIYGIIHAAGGYTAWSDKHAAYAAVNGYQAGPTPTNVDDYYSPEVNSNVIPLPGIMTASHDDCSTVPSDVLSDWTTSFTAIRCYDQLKVNAVVNWINGQTHLNTGPLPAGVPVIFGMNFQAVSVGQKLVNPTSGKGGYMDAAGDPTGNMLNQIEFVDKAIGQMVAALQSATTPNLFANTTIIITAKHGQSPVDPNLFFPIPGHAPANNGASPSTILITTVITVCSLKRTVSSPLFIARRVSAAAWDRLKTTSLRSGSAIRASWRKLWRRCKLTRRLPASARSSMAPRSPTISSRLRRLRARRTSSSSRRWAWFIPVATKSRPSTEVSPTTTPMSCCWSPIRAWRKAPIINSWKRSRWRRRS